MELSGENMGQMGAVMDFCLKGNLALSTYKVLCMLYVLISMHMYVCIYGFILQNSPKFRIQNKTVEVKTT